MSSIKQYYNKDVVVRYHPDERVIQLQLKPKSNKENLSKLEDQLKTTLSVDSTDTQGPRQKILTLSPEANESSVHEFLQSILEGGKETGDAVEAEKSEEQQVPPPIPPSPGVVPGGAPPTSPGQLPMESFNVLDAFSLLMENSLLKEGTYRSGEHWDILAQALGKGKQQIDDRDVLSLRRVYTKKKRSRSRDQVLRALDRVSRYFIRKLRNTIGDEAAQLFKNKYKKIGHLTPIDYAEPQDQQMSPEQPEDQQGFDPKSIDFSEFFPKDDESSSEEDDEETPEEKYGEEPEEEYPD